jgi:luciferase family oxidoreductase group 1
MSLPLSVLDLAMVGHDADSSEALGQCGRVAQAADRLGFTRFWVAEHHNMATVASTSPAVLLSHLGSQTTRIRLGSGGVMLPNHAPLVIAEQFSMLEALYPGRIDLGIGRAPGTDRATAAALRRSIDRDEDDRFPRDLIDLMGMLGDHRVEHSPLEGFVATPVASSYPAIFLLGSSGFSAQLAGLLGLPFAFAHHFEMGGTLVAAEVYHRTFRPSEVLEAPHLIVTATTVIGPTQEKAEWLAAPSRLRRAGLRRGLLYPLLPPDEALAHAAYPTEPSLRAAGMAGTVGRVAEELVELVTATNAEELMVYPVAYDVDDRIGTLEELSLAFDLDPA